MKVISIYCDLCEEQIFSHDPYYLLPTPEGEMIVCASCGKSNQHLSCKCGCCGTFVKMTDESSCPDHEKEFADCNFKKSCSITRLV
jgi:hypothetical protein